MRIRMVVPFILLALAACDSTETMGPKIVVSTTSQVRHMVIQNTGPASNVMLVAGSPTDRFSNLGLSDLNVIDRAMVADVNSSADTVWVGYAITSAASPENFSFAQVNWSLSGNMGVRSTKMVQAGNMRSLYDVSMYSYDGFLVSQRSGPHLLTVSGNDFAFGEVTNVQGGNQTWLTLVVYVPLTCSGIEEMQVESNGLTETQSDGATTQRFRHLPPGFKVMCIGDVTTSIDVQHSVIQSEAPMKLSEYVRLRRMK